MKLFTIILLFSLTVAKSCQDTQHIYVADHLVDCTGVDKQKCMLVKGKIVDNWSTFYGDIEGFTYEEGYEYLLGVKVTKIKNPPADASNLKYTLVEVYEKKKVKEPITLNNKWKVISMMGVDKLENNPTIEFDLEGKKFTGNAGCNNFFGTYDPESKKLDFSKMGLTRKMCPDMTVENNFLNNLNHISYYTIEYDQLRFFNSNNEVLMTCEIDK